MLDKPITDRRLYAHIAEGVANSIERVLADHGLLGQHDQMQVQRAGFTVDRGALKSLAGMLWAPCCHPDDKSPRPPQRRADVAHLRSAPYTAEELAASMPEPASLYGSDRPGSTTANGDKMERLYAALRAGPGARDAAGRGIALLCPLHPDTSPSAIVFFGNGNLYCSACAKTYKLREWVNTPQGRALLGEGLALEILAPSLAPTAVPLASLVTPLTIETLHEPPPPRQYLVRDGSGDGVMPRGRVCLLGAPGGAGKSNAMVDLAASVASGGNWFGVWPTEQGRVLLILAEETREEVERRLHFALRFRGDENLNSIAENITPLPAAGVGVALTYERDSDTGTLPETHRAEELREMLRAAAHEGRPYSLVVLDPLSRFAGADVEKDSAAATRYVQVLETLTSLEFGRPTVLVPAHTRKRSKDDERGSTDPLRGSSALRDGARWVAMLERRQFVEGAPELLDLQIGKSNYGRRTALMLCADAAREGAMRAATDAEIALYDAAKAPARAGRAAQQQSRNADLSSRILDALSEAPASTNGLVGRLKAGRGRVITTLEALAAQGRISRLGGKTGVWRVVSASGLDHPTRLGGLWSGGLAPEGGRRPDHQTAPQTKAFDAAHETTPAPRTPPSPRPCVCDGGPSDPTPTPSGLVCGGCFGDLNSGVKAVSP